MVIAGDSIQSGTWSKEDTVRQAVLVVLICVDWLQTHEIVKDPNNRTESNPVLGDHPTMGAANLYILGGLLLSGGVALFLPKDYRKGFQYVIIGAEISAIMNNYNAGIRINF